MWAWHTHMGMPWIHDLHMAAVSITITMFGGPADGRTMAAPRGADYVDIHVKIGRPMFDDGKVSTLIHRYWIERFGGLGIALHYGPVAYRRDEPSEQRP